MKHTGTIISVKENGFGFIKPAAGGSDIFFHRTAVEGLEFGDALIELRVEFEITEGTRGPRAVAVRAVD